jgi:8-oxo-dGTP pyrophosphatase MutT (NUDIX family)
VELIRKVYAYITREGKPGSGAGNELLVFRHIGLEEAGIQVPGGTLEPGEAPEEGVMREAFEETGLSGLKLLRSLGTHDQDLAAYGSTGLHRRHFYHLACPPGVPETWQHYETHRSDGEAEPILFDFFWIPIAEAEKILHPYFIAKIADLMVSQ